MMGPYTLVDYTDGDGEVKTMTLRRFAWKRVLQFIEFYDGVYEWWEIIGGTLSDFYTEIMNVATDTLTEFGCQKCGFEEEGMEYEVEIATSGRVQQFLLAHPDFKKLMKV